MLCLICRGIEDADLHDVTSPRYEHDFSPRVEHHCDRCDVAEVPTISQRKGGDASLPPPASGASTHAATPEADAIPDQSVCGNLGCTIPRWRHAGYHHEWTARA